MPPNRLIWTNDSFVALQTLLDERDPETGDWLFREAQRSQPSLASVRESWVPPETTRAVAIAPGRLSCKPRASCLVGRSRIATASP